MRSEKSNSKNIRKDMRFDKREYTDASDKAENNSNQNINDSKADDDSKQNQKDRSRAEKDTDNDKKEKDSLMSEENKNSDECRECRGEFLLTAQRLQAEFDNYRKKSETRLQQTKLDGQIDAISKILPALDSFVGAKKIISDPKILEGVNMIEKQLISALTSLNVEKIDAVGKEFDPNLHNALAIVSDNTLENNIIKEEYQAGYKINDKIIRYSQVIVNKKEEK
ncbi:MAG: nucleotide exchange factor GrpE [Clostridia bacterium]|jgi:molecular chaperone GrpE|nr:nucleotide exchange factor GrpE [Clostridia bacterium]